MGPNMVSNWLNSKLKTVQHLFEREISALIFQEATTRLAEGEELMTRLHRHMNACGRVLEGWDKDA